MLESVCNVASGCEGFAFHRRLALAFRGVKLCFRPLASLRGVAQLVECAVWDREVAGSSPATPTILYINRREPRAYDARLRVRPPRP